MPEQPRDEAFHFAGDRLGKFVILGELGRGSMGVVYEAFQEDLKRKVALKVLPANIALDIKQVRRFKREAESVARLRHDHVIQIYEVGQIENTHYFAMEMVDGAGFASHSFIRDRAFVDDAARMIRDAARGLAHAHGRGVIHRDVKPSNLLVDRGNRVVVTDFGLARLSESTSLTSTDAIVGTPKYMAPEQILPGTYPLDGRCDIYGLGATLYEAVCGHPPLEAPSVQAFLKAILEERPIWPRKQNKLVPHDLSTIIMRCLEKHPDERYADADALADDLERFLKGERIVAKPKGMLARGVGFVGRHKVVSTISLVAAIAIVVTLVLTVNLRETGRSERLQRQIAMLGLTEEITDLPAAIESAEALQKSHPNDPEVTDLVSTLLLRHATLLLRGSQEEIRDRFPLILDIYMRVGGAPGLWQSMLLFECGRSADAVALLKRGALPSPLAALVRARLALLGGDYEAALTALAQAPGAGVPGAQRVFYYLVRASAERALDRFSEASTSIDNAHEASANLQHPWLIWRVDRDRAFIESLIEGGGRFDAVMRAIRGMQDRTAAVLSNLARLSEDMASDEQFAAEQFITRILDMAGEQTSGASDLVQRGRARVQAGVRTGDEHTQALGHLLAAIGLLSGGDAEAARAELTRAEDEIDVPQLLPYTHWARSLSHRVERDIDDALNEATNAIRWAVEIEKFPRDDLQLLVRYAQTVGKLASTEERIRFEKQILEVLSPLGKLDTWFTSPRENDPAARGDRGG